MFPSKDEIKAWMKKEGHTRDWLGQKCGGLSKGTINNWLSTSILIPDRALELIRLLMAEDDAKAKQREIQQEPELERFSVECTPDEFDKINAAANAKDMLIRDWAVKALIEAVERDAKEKSLGVIQPIRPATKKAHLMAAAGSPIDAEVLDWEGKNGIIDVRICGLSMAPKLNDGDVVGMRLKSEARNPYMKKGLIYLVEYDGGYTIKRYNTRKPKPEEEGEEWVENGRVKVLESLNPDHKEIIIKQPVEWFAWLDE